MDKSSSFHRLSSRRARPLGRYMTAAAVSLIIVAVLTRSGISLADLTSVVKGQPLGPFEHARKEFSWDSLKSHTHIQYAACDDSGKFQCARLELPLDWHNASNQKTIDLALLRVPARVPVTDPRYGGAMLINPGGPGGSGVNAAIVLGSYLQDTIDSKDKFFDIISFDPRGVGHTTPSGHCFDSRLDRYSFYERRYAAGILGSSNVALSEQYYMSKALGKACEPDNADSILHHMTTPYVARDMLAVVEAHGEWREKQIHGKTSSNYDTTKELLQYWGFSYGTLLGGTFASLFPERVGRMILDGVVDSDEYYTASWSGNLVDTEKVVDAVYDGCAAMGPERCALASADRQNGSSIRAAIETLLTDLQTHPIPVSTKHSAQLITFSDVKSALLTTMYAPAIFPGLALMLKPILEDRNASLLASQLLVRDKFSCKQPAPVDQVAQTSETLAHILCSDGESRSNMTMADVDAHLQKQLAISPTAGDIWAGIMLECVGMTTRSPWTFDRSKYGARKTANPVLFVGNTGDPVTPLVNAYKMQEKFAGSHVLVHDGFGHCSISAGYSSCTANALREYFTHGRLPRDELKCPVDLHPMTREGDGPEGVLANMSQEVARVAKAYGKMEEIFRDQAWGLGRTHAASRLRM